MYLHIYPEEKLSKAMNMAVDSVLLETASEFLIRHYSWGELCYSFGYTQRFREINFPNLIRRPTAGGVVNHSNDFTYTLIIPSKHQWYHLKIISLYKMIHSILKSTFNSFQIFTYLQSETLKSSQCCFNGSGVLYDLMFENKKIAGAAIKRTKSALLFQGSILKEHFSSISWDLFYRIFISSLSKESGLIPLFIKKEIREDLLKKYYDLFNSDAWMQKR